MIKKLQGSSSNCLLSIIIKAYNEEERIESCIKSALKATAEIPSEIILADSLSDDQTVFIASKHPISIVQLTNADERCCGIGPQLGYLESKGDFIYILDGDMELESGFLEKALTAMGNDPTLGGVGGMIKECIVDNIQFQNRANCRSNIFKTVEVEYLGMGGIYRREAIESSGYFSNRNLHAFEELELGLRLQAKGWKLIRINTPAIKHYGHSLSTFQLLISRLRSGYTKGPGELLRSSLKNDYFFKLLWKFKAFIGTIFLWIMLILSLSYIHISPYPLWIVLCILLILIVIMTVRKKSLFKGLFSILDWTFFAAGTITGFCKRQVAPKSPIAKKNIQERF